MTDTVECPTIAPEPTRDAATPMPVSLDAAPLKTALSASEGQALTYAYDRGNVYAVLPDGRHTRAYTSHDAAKRAVARGALFTRADYVKHMRRVPAWYADVDIHS